MAKFLRKAEESIQMYHTVPSIVANTKQRAEVFQNKWDYYIGKAFYHMGVMKMERDWLKKLRVEDSDQEIVFTVKMYICD